MTVNPANLLAVRALLQPHLYLTVVELGIAGDTAHVTSGDSYHLGRPQQRTSGYAATESPRDKAGLNESACALDVGYFEIRVRGKSHDLRSFSAWAVAQCKANKPDTHDIREIIYTLDGKTVRRWDRLGRRTTGDSSHLFHTHFSFFRDAVKAGRDQRPLFIRYLTEIGLLEGDDMTPEQNGKLQFLYDALLNGGPDAGVEITLPNGTKTSAIIKKLDYTLAKVDAIAARVSGDLVDEGAVAADLLATLTPQAIVAAIPPTLAKQVADELAARLVS